MSVNVIIAIKSENKYQLLVNDHHNRYLKMLIVLTFCAITEHSLVNKIKHLRY